MNQHRVKATLGGAAGLAIGLVLTVSVASWAGARSVDVVVVPADEYVAAHQSCLTEIETFAGSPPVAGSFAGVVAAGRSLTLTAVVATDPTRPTERVRCSVRWDSGFAHPSVEVGPDWVSS